MFKLVSTPNAPLALGPYSHAVRAGKLIFCSGQTGIDPKTGTLVEGLENQVQQTLANIKSVVKAAGSDMQHVIKTTVYLTNVAEFPIMNAIYEKAFAPHKPARATVEVSNLPKGALIEIEAIAVSK